MKQVTRGHNIVADGWAKASSPNLYPNPQPTYKQKKHTCFPSSQFDDPRPIDGRTNGQTNGRTKPLIELHATRPCKLFGRSVCHKIVLQIFLYVSKHSEHFEYSTVACVFLS